MPRHHRPTVAQVSALVALLVVAPAAIAFEPYTTSAHRARQAVRLDIERTELDLATVYVDPGDPGYSTYAPGQQLLALLCELEAQARGLPHPGGGGTEVDDAQADAHFAAAIEEISDIIGGTILDPQPNELAGSNLHSAMDAGLFAAYVLHRFPDGSPLDTTGSGWSSTTLDAASRELGVSRGETA